MKRNILSKILSLFLLFSIITLTSCGTKRPTVTNTTNIVTTQAITTTEQPVVDEEEVIPLKDKIGVTSWGLRYVPGIQPNENSLVKSSELIAEIGCSVIKISFGNPSGHYRLDDWSKTDLSSFVTQAQDPSYKAVLDNPNFKTYYFNITDMRKSINYRDGLSNEEYNSTFKEIYDFATYLLNTYQGTGKTFIFQNWEADNALGTNYNTVESKLLYRNYADWINCRQDAVNKARDDFGMTSDKKVRVFHALEINKLVKEDNVLRCVTGVVPYTYCDLYAYSSYESKDQGVVESVDDVVRRLTSLLEYYEENLPSLDAYPHEPYFKKHRLTITECGYPDKQDGYTGERTKMVIEGHLRVMEEFGFNHFVFWEICCNEVTGNNASTINSLYGNDLRNYHFVPYDINGFYLIRPDGVKTYTYNYLKNVCTSNSLDALAENPGRWLE